MSLPDHFGDQPSNSSTVAELAPPLIDSHVHLDDKLFEPDIDDVLQFARELNVVAQVVPAISRALWPALKQLCSEHSDLFACYGLHPCFCDEHSLHDIEELSQWVAKEKPIAIGECGLDYCQTSGTGSASADKAFQHQLFSAQLALSREFNLPVIVHANKAVEDVIGIIRASGHSRGVIHSFNGSYQQAIRLIDLGYKLGFGGAATFGRATRLRDMIKKLPLHSILLETDAPFQSDTLHSGQRNQPAWLIDVWRNLSQLRDESASEVALTTTRNAIELFKLPLSTSQVADSARISQPLNNRPNKETDPAP